MRAVTMRGQRLVLDRLPDPEPRSGQVLVRTLACGICGSDLHMLRHAPRMVEIAQRTGQPVHMDLTRDVVMGHEFCAEIVDFGPDTQQKLKRGARVCSLPIAWGPQGFGSVGYSNDFPGGYGELMLLNEALLLEVPNGLETDLAALTEPMAVGHHAVELACLSGGERPLVIGCGPVGLAVIAALRVAGAGPVLAADFSPRRRELALEMGADVAIDPAEHSPYSRWRELANPDAGGPGAVASMLFGGDAEACVIFECVGVPGVMQQIFEGAPRRSRVVVVGVCMESDPVEPILGIYKELNVQFAFGYTPQEFSDTLRQLSEGEIAAGPLITGRVGLSEVPEAFEELSNPGHHAKLLVEAWR